MTSGERPGLPAVVVGTAGHIDHGKTALLRALTGIDADRLPEERARGMTIDVGYAHLVLDDGGVIDFVDVPGHDRLVGNMLVGAGEIDAALLVVAADDGLRPQTLEHLELLDALGLTEAIAVVTKADLLLPDDPARAARLLEVGALLDRTRFAGAPVLLVSAETGEGLAGLRTALAELRQRVLARRAVTPAGAAPRLAIDRAFSVRGRGVVVTGTLRGGPIASDARLRVVPAEAEVRVRGIQVHGREVAVATGGRVALNLAGIEPDELHRGQVVAAGSAVEATERLLVVLHRPADVGPLRAGPLRAGERRRRAWPPSESGLRLHLGTAECGAHVSRGTRSLRPLPDGRVVAGLRLDRRLAVAPGDAFVLRRPSPPATIAGGRVLDGRLPVGSSRRRMTPERLSALATADDPATAANAMLDLHGALPVTRWRALDGDPAVPVAGPLVLVRDVLDDLAATALVTVAAHHDAEPDSAGVPVAALRTALAHELRRRVAASPPDASGAAAALVEALVATGRLARDGDRVRDPARSAGPPPALAAAMDRLVALLDVSAPPAFDEAVRASGCPVEGVRALEASGRIVRLDPDLAYASTAYGRIADLALSMARSAPLSPAALRDATGSSRRYVMAILEDLGRRGVLRRTPDGHVPGPRAAAHDPGRPA